MSGKLRETAYAKVNLALHVRSRRDDGYHRLETLFAFAREGDTIEAEDAPDISLAITGPNAGALCNDRGNLVIRAALALQAATGTGRGARLSLHKRLPVAAGLGGGSADAAATLRLLARLWGIDAADQCIAAIAATLGADVPACVLSETCTGGERGDIIMPFADPGIAGKPTLIANPGVALSTPQVFAGWDGKDGGALDPRGWRNARNDLTASAIRLVPSIASLLELLKEQPGAEVVRMSGSGASCFALFGSIEARDAAARRVPFWHMATSLR